MMNIDVFSHSSSFGGAESALYGPPPPSPWWLSPTVPPFASRVGRIEAIFGVGMTRGRGMMGLDIGPDGIRAIPAPPPI